MKFYKNKLAVSIVVLSVTFLILIGYSVKRSKVSIFEDGLGVVINSVSGVLYKTSNNVKDSLSFIFNFKKVKEENIKLKQENRELQNKALQYDSVLNENETLRKMVNFKNQKSQFDYVGCDIIGKSGGNFFDGFYINKGTKDGVGNGMVVVTGDGLVGQITSVRRNWAIVQTLANENIQVSGLVESTRENSGVIKGYRDSENKLLAKIYFLPINSKIKKDDVILTSGLGGLYPKDIKIGTVLSVEEDKGKIMKTAVLKPYVDFYKLEEVFVIIPKDKIDINYGEN